MTEPTATCAHCAADLTSTSHYSDWRLALTNERIPARSLVDQGAKTLPRITYFCGPRCLAMWVYTKDVGYINGMREMQADDL
jgi:hypothetical protein